MNHYDMLGKLSLSDFKKGDKVRYCPMHGGFEDGMVTSVGTQYVYVRYLGTTDTSQATSPMYLIKR